MKIFAQKFWLVIVQIDRNYFHNPFSYFSLFFSRIRKYYLYLAIILYINLATLYIKLAFAALEENFVNILRKPLKVCSIPNVTTCLKSIGNLKNLFVVKYLKKGRE